MDFPTTPDQAKAWQPTTARIALHRRVLVHARTRIEGAWAAYCFPVPGVNHDHEECLWELDGSKLPESVARSLFPRFDDIPYAH